MPKLTQDFKTNKQHESYAKRYKVDINKELKSFKEKHMGKNSPNWESRFSTYLKKSRATQAKADCLSAAVKAMSSFTPGEVEDYANLVFKQARSYPNLKGQAAIKQAIKDVGNKQLQELFEDCAIKARNVSKYAEIEDRIRSEKANLRSVGIPRGKNQAFTLKSFQESALGQLGDAFYLGISDEHFNFMANPKNFMDILGALDGDPSSDIAKKIAERHNSYKEVRNTAMVSSDALKMRYVSKYKYLDQHHDAAKIMNSNQSMAQAARNIMKGKKFNPGNAKKEWVDFYKTVLDFEEMDINGSLINLDGTINDESVTKMLEKSFDSITTNKTELLTTSLVANDREAIKAKRIMKFYFKDWKSYGKAQMKYGNPSFLAALEADRVSASRKIGTARMFGDSPLHTYLDLRKLQHEVGIKNKKGEYAPPGTTWFHNTDLIYRDLFGGANRAINPSLANFSASIRALTGINKLYNIASASMPDVVMAASYAERAGFGKGLNYYKIVGRGLVNYIRKSSEGEYIASRYSHLINSKIGYMIRMAETNNIGSFTDKISHTFFKWNGLNKVDSSNKVTAMEAISRGLNDVSNKKYGELNPYTRKHLSYFDINESEWDVLRTKNKKNLFTTDNVDAISDDELKKLHSKQQLKIPLTQYRDDLYRKVYSLMWIAADNTVLNPDTFERAFIMHRGTSPGEPLGEVVRSFWQFKPFSVAFIDRVGYQGLGAFDGFAPKLSYAIKFMTATMALNTMATAFTYLLQGKSFPDVTRMTPAQATFFLAKLSVPGLGVFSAIADPNNTNNDLLWTILRSPSLGMLQSFIMTFKNLLWGDLKGAKKEVKKTLRYLLPYDGLPVVSPLVREAAGEKPHLEPGQKQLYGK